jgi:hypothetical protein
MNSALISQGHGHPVVALIETVALDECSGA